LFYSYSMIAGPRAGPVIQGTEFDGKLNVYI
jgi:hypothetical protein